MTTIPTRSQRPNIVRPGAAPLRGPGGAGPGGGLTGKDVILIFRKRKLMIILSVAICTFLAIVITLLWSMYAPLYTAGALLAVNPPRASELRPGVGLLGGEIMDRLLASTAQMAMGRGVMVDAVTGPSPESADLRRTQWFEKDRGSAVARLQKEIIITPVIKTNYISIRKTGRNKEELAIIVNAVSIAIVSQKNERNSIRIDNDIRRLEEDLRNLDTNLAKARTKALRSELADRTEPIRIAELEGKLAMYTAKQRLLEREITGLELARSQAESALEAIKGLKQEQLVQLPEVQIEKERDVILQNLRNRKIMLETEHENAERKYGPKHLVVRGFQSRIESIEKQVKVHITELETRFVAYLRKDREGAPNIIAQQLIGIRTEHLKASKEVEDAIKELEALKSRYEGIREGIRRQQQQADREVIALMARKSRLVNRLDELRLERRGLQALQLDRKAFPPDAPSWPKWSVMMPLGILLGLIIGVGLAFLLEFIDTSIKNPADVSRRVDLPLLGIVPHSNDLEDEIEDMRLAFMSAPNSIVTEAYRQIRTTLLFSGPADQRRSLLITSPLPGDGRTTVAMNIAGCIARGGRKVLVVDANFRQPMINTLFPQVPQEGFSSALVGQVSWRDQVHEVEENLCVMAAGPLPPNPAELLGSEQLRKLIDEMQTDYDQVIFDSAPCVVVTDSPVLSTQVDGVILVVRAGANTYGIVQRTRDILNRVGAHILGVVLNGVRVTAGGYLRKNYDTYYEYHQQPQLPGSEPSEQTEPVGEEA